MQKDARQKDVQQNDVRQQHAPQIGVRTSRRHWLLAGSGLLTALGLARLARSGQMDKAVKSGEEHYEVELTDAQWRARLSPQQYHVLREQGTEAAFASPLNHEKRRGTFTCAGCALALFASETKYDSGTGWPSFWKPLEHAVGTSPDSSFGMERISVHCHRCGGHLGHVFDDGPQPTGLRYCMNGVALGFVPASGQS